MILHISERIARGEFGDVFRPSNGERVVKVYRRVANVQEDKEGRGLFRREEIAYTNVMRFEDLRPHVPAYYRRPVIEEILNERGNSVAANYHLDCSLELDFVPGECLKFHELPDEYEAIAVQLLSRFDGRVAYDYDCSFFNWTDAERIIVIDFAPTS
jgi:hypothetical protein